MTTQISNLSWLRLPRNWLTEIYAPVSLYHEFKDASTAADVNPNYCKPAGMMMRLMKATDEYGGGVATYYMTSGKLLNICLDLLRSDA